MALPDIPRLQLPLRVENGVYATVEQDTIDDIVNASEGVVRYETGYLPFLPDFGRAPVLFQQSTRPIGQDIRAALAEWEPRAGALAEDEIDGMARHIRVNIDG